MLRKSVSSEQQDNIQLGWGAATTTKKPQTKAKQIFVLKNGTP